MAPSGAGWDAECDARVVGSGAGALTAALVATTAGLHTILIEKTEVFGGTTAYSGGGMWLPNNPVELAGGVPDTPELARRYVAATVGDRTAGVRRERPGSARGRLADLRSLRRGQHHGVVDRSCLPRPGIANRLVHGVRLHRRSPHRLVGGGPRLTRYLGAAR